MRTGSLFSNIDGNVVVLFILATVQQLEQRTTGQTVVSTDRYGSTFISETQDNICVRLTEERVLDADFNFLINKESQ